jgi:hypothetical protein
MISGSNQKALQPSLEPFTARCHDGREPRRDHQMARRLGRDGWARGAGLAENWRNTDVVARIMLEAAYRTDHDLALAWPASKMPPAKDTVIAEPAARINGSGRDASRGHDPMHHVRATMHDAAATPDGALECPNSHTATESVGLSPCRADESEPSVQVSRHIFIDFRNI